MDMPRRAAGSVGGHGRAWEFRSNGAEASQPTEAAHQYIMPHSRKIYQFVIVLFVRIKFD